MRQNCCKTKTWLEHDKPGQQHVYPPNFLQSCYFIIGMQITFPNDFVDKSMHSYDSLALYGLHFPSVTLHPCPSTHISRHIASSTLARQNVWMRLNIQHNHQRQFPAAVGGISVAIDSACTCTLPAQHQYDTQRWWVTLSEEDITISTCSTEILVRK